MGQKQETTQRIELIAEETLTQFENVAEVPKSALGNEQRVGQDALATVNTFTSTAAIGRLAPIDRENMQSARILARESA